MSNERDERNSQFFPNPDAEVNHRLWVFAPRDEDGHITYPVPPGTAVEKSKETGTPAPRGWNREGQRYFAPAIVLAAKREVRATDEYELTLFLRRRAYMYELRTKDGNYYDCVTNESDAWESNWGATMCQCPDEARLRLSGYNFSVVCKHVIMTRARLLTAFDDPLLWCVAAVSEASGFDERTIQQMCKTKRIPAVKKFETWGIDPDDIPHILVYLEGLKVNPDAPFPDFVNIIHPAPPTSV